MLEDLRVAAGVLPTNGKLASRLSPEGERTEGRVAPDFGVEF
jgi:hypothetical protein